MSDRVGEVPNTRGKSNVNEKRRTLQSCSLEKVTEKHSKKAHNSSLLLSSAEGKFEEHQLPTSREHYEKLLGPDVANTEPFLFEVTLSKGSNLAIKIDAEMLLICTNESCHGTGKLKWYIVA